jgi:aspartyl aminopeptidase
MKQQQFTEKFLKFLAAAPTSFHAAKEVKKALLAQSFEELQEKATWKLKSGRKYLCHKEGSLIAFIMPEKKLEEALIFASHTDSPALKLKPNGEFQKEGMVMWGVEIYGAPLLTSWLNRDLGLAGKVLFLDKKGKMEEALVDIRSHPALIPQLAIHLDREVNEKGLLLNKQDHLNALAAIASPKVINYLLKLLAQELPIKELLAHDLFLYPLEAPATIGSHQELISSYRLDSLASVWAILQALLSSKKASPHELRMMALWDHEEIGSGTSTGAESPYFSHILERIALNQDQNREDYFKLIHNSLSVSVDLGHAVHPNYPDKHDARHKPVLGGGILIKTHAQKKYATDASNAKRVIESAKKGKIPFMAASGRNDIPSGTTIGPIHSALTGISTVDIGIGQLSMHSARELAATKDIYDLYQLLAIIAG